jgi:hypothetical protein
MRKFFFLFLVFYSLFIYSQGVKILVGSPVRQKPAILQEFLHSLKRLQSDTYALDFYFVDDNTNKTSKALLQEFSSHQKGKCLIDHPPKKQNDSYICDEHTHKWNDELVWKVARFKDEMIQYAKIKNYDYLFLIDSDLILHPNTLKQLLLAHKDIISNIFWTKWTPEARPTPQVWLSDHYTQYEKRPGEILSSLEKAQRQNAFYDRLEKPGVYEVGGLGACTLISKKAIKKGISFKKIQNLSYWGEDRHFCVRALALGLSLFVDTHYPALHVYRESELCKVQDFIQKSTVISSQNSFYPRLTLSMIVKNEANRYLKRVLKNAKKYITDAVIIDDASTDNTVEVCKQILKDMPLKIVENKESQFHNEVCLRKQQWKETIETNPDWILFLDADEIFEDKFQKEVKNLILSSTVDAYFFRLYDFWDENHYREDNCWTAHKRYHPFLIRYKPNSVYKWKETPQHCGRMPYSVYEFTKKNSSLRVKHYGWAKEKDRLTKYKRYKKLDPKGIYGNNQQYLSILDKLRILKHNSKYKDLDHV